jgi:hypothetical protein
LLAAASWHLLACGENGTHRDADGDVPREDGEVEADDGADEDSDEGIEGEAEAEADGDDGLAEDGDGETAAGNCTAPLDLACGDDLAGTTTGARAVMNGYSCGPWGFSADGPENVYALRGTTENRVTVTMTPAASTDLDLYVLPDVCTPAACAASGSSGLEGEAETVTFATTLGGTSYVVVEGYAGDSGDYAISVRCAVGEVCDNDSDDNANGLIDCEDSQCWPDPVCAEVCDNDLDDDFDGLIDCADSLACVADAACREAICDDGLDDDGDGRTDCLDWDCAGSTGCAAGTGTIGEPCSSHDECAGRVCLLEDYLGWPGGYCSQGSGIDPACGGCPSGSTCHDLLGRGSGPYFCLRACGALADCRAAGQLCAPAGVCVGGCTDDAQCAPTHACAPPDPADPDAARPCIPATEVCTGGLDEDGDTLADCLDTDCVFLPECTTDVVPLDGGDSCTDATTVPLPASERGVVLLSGTLVSTAGDEHSPSCPDGGDDSVDAAYSFTLTRPARIAVDLRGGTGGGLLPKPFLSLALACGEPDVRCAQYYDVPDHARIEGIFSARTWVVYVDAYAGATGSYTLGLDFADP